MRSNRIHSEEPVNDQKLITGKSLGIASLLGVSILCGIAIVFLPAKFLPHLLALPVGLIVVFLVLLDPVVGIYLYYFLDVIRPQEIFPALRAVKIAIVVEIITLISWTFFLIRNKKVIYWPKFNWLFLASVGVLGASTLTAMNNRWAFDTFKIMIVMFTIYVISTNVINSLSRLNSLIGVILLSHFGLALTAMGLGRVEGSYLMGDENELALAMNTMIPFAFFYFLEAHSKLLRALALLILTILILAGIASLSRGGMIGLFAVLAFCIFRTNKRLVVTSLIAFLGVVMILFAPPKYWEEMQTISDTKETTAQTRLHYWKAAFEMYKDYPIIGVGGSNGGARMPEYITGVRDPNTEWGRTFHGTLPQVMAEQGTLGLGLYLAMMYMAFRTLLSIRSKALLTNEPRLRSLADSIMGGIVAFIASATFLSSAYSMQLWMLYTLTFCLVRCSSPNDHVPRRSLSARSM